MQNKAQQNLCPICNKQISSDFILDSSLKYDLSENIEKKINYDNICLDCKEMKSIGFIFIGAVRRKTTDLNAPYRSGNIWCVTFEAAKKILNDENALKLGVAFLDIEDAHSMGFPQVNFDA